jgi:hypothetical protein
MKPIQKIRRLRRLRTRYFDLCTAYHSYSREAFSKALKLQHENADLALSSNKRAIEHTTKARVYLRVAGYLDRKLRIELDRYAETTPFKW